VTRWAMPAPRWAQDLAIRVALDEGRDDLPDLTWRRGRRHVMSSGHVKHLADGGGVTITTGRDRRDQRLVLLHEMAHWLTPGEYHGPVFWDKAWELYRRYGVPIRYALARERGYRRGALVAYRKAQQVVPVAVDVGPPFPPIVQGLLYLLIH